MMSAVLAVLLASTPAAPEAGISEALARERAAAVRDLRYDLVLQVPGLRAEPVTGRVTARFVLNTAGRIVLDFARPREAVRAVRLDGRDAAFEVVNGHIVVASAASGAARACRGVRRRRRGPQPQRRVPLHAVRPGAGASRVSLLRSAGSEGALHAHAHRARGLAGGEQRRGREAHGGRRRRGHDDAGVCRDAAAAHLSVRVRRRPVPGGDRRARRPRVADVPSRDRRGQGGAQPRRHLRPARLGAAVARGLHRDSLSVRQVRHRRDPVVHVRRHGTRRRDLLQRVRPAARRVGDAEPDARSRQRDRARDVAHVVRRPRHHALVQRRVDERGVRQLHGGQDREPVVPRREPRAALPAGALPVGLRHRPHRRHQRHPPGARQPRSGRADVRPDHLRQGADRDAAARDDHGPRRVSRRPARLSQDATSSATPPGSTWCARSTRARRAIWRPGAGRGWRSAAVRRSPLVSAWPMPYVGPGLQTRATVSRRSRCPRATRWAAGWCGRSG